MLDDRLYIDKECENEIRGIIKQKDFFSYNNQKDVFMFAMALGADLYRTNANLQNSKEGFFNDKDFQEIDKALLCSLVFPELRDIQELTDKHNVYEIAQCMADKGFTLLLDKMRSVSPEIFILQYVEEADALYEEAKKNNLFF